MLCSSCCSSLPLFLPPLCTRCGKALSSGTLCSDCQNHPPEVDGVRSVYCFDGTVRQAILHFKYQNVKALAIPLAELMGDYLKTNPLPTDVLVPVPLHPKRLRHHGYNHSSLLAGELGKLASLPLAENSLIRLRNTPPQARTKSAEERRVNVAQAFVCQDQGLGGKRILLIDDVCTSGATLNSCATALKAAGAASVWGFTLAREV